MKRPCEHEEDILRAVHLPELTPELRLHVDSCADCAEIVALAQFFEHDAKSLSVDALPDASAVWGRAMLLARTEAAARAFSPIRWVTSAAVVVMITGVCWLVFRPAGWLTSLSELLNTSGQHIPSGIWASRSLFAGAITISCALSGAAYMLWADHPSLRLEKT